MKLLISLFRTAVPMSFALMALVSTSSGCAPSARPTSPLPDIPTASVSYYTYEVVNAFPHDAGAFTQGLAFENGYLYEGTGLQGRSSLRRVRPETGVIVHSVLLPHDYFGEGVTICMDRIVQLTWRSGVGLVYDKADFRLTGQFTYETEGWGLTCDGQRLIMSDGTDKLYFLDPETYASNGYVNVHDRGAAVSGLNELEYIDGLVYANVWPTDMIAVIDPADGRVAAWMDLSGLLATRDSTQSVDVLNGIAYDADNNRLFVTGKFWPWLFEIGLVPQ